MNHSPFQLSRWAKATFALLLFTTGAFAEPITYHIDNTHSSIQFTIPFFGVAEVAGRFDQFCGTFIYDRENPAQNKVELYIYVNSINTGIGKRDRDLREGYFTTAQYPLIRFESQNIKGNGREFDVTGTLNMHGVIKEISFHLRTIGQIDAPHGKEWGFKSSAIDIDRIEYKISRDVAADKFTIGRTATIACMIRLRENTLDRKQFEKEHPAITQDGLEKITGTFVNDKNAGEMTFVWDQNKLFVTFRDNDWVWMRELLKTGENQFRINSRNDLIEWKDNSIVWHSDGNEDMVFLRK